MKAVLKEQAAFLQVQCRPAKKKLRERKCLWAESFQTGFSFFTSLWHHLTLVRLRSLSNENMRHRIWTDRPTEYAFVCSEKRDYSYPHAHAHLHRTTWTVAVWTFFVVRRLSPFFLRTCAWATLNRPLLYYESKANPTQTLLALNQQKGKKTHKHIQLDLGKCNPIYCLLDARYFQFLAILIRNHMLRVSVNCDHYNCKV